MLSIAMQAAPSPSAGFMNIMPLILIFGIFYVLLIRPQQKRAKEHQALLQTVTRGDNIVTNGGILGKVVKAADDELTIEIAEGVRIKMLRAAIADVRGRPEPANDRADAGKKKPKAKK
ncbi:MAG: preprotein translocase subunit YajC [Robiginitomaculum sp.]